VDNFRFKGARHAARIDQQVGERIRKRRTLLGYTQEQLAEALDISYQQIQKYETGANRVSAGRLYQIAQRLETPVSHFFEGLGIDYEVEEQAANTNRATIELVRNFNTISDAGVRLNLAGLVKSLAQAQDTQAMEANGRENGHVSQSENGHAAQENGRIKASEEV
jgi:transcriptional regulator with XRE-family HTH domain